MYTGGAKRNKTGARTVGDFGGNLVLVNHGGPRLRSQTRQTTCSVRCHATRDRCEMGQIRTSPPNALSTNTVVQLGFESEKQQGWNYLLCMGEKERENPTLARVNWVSSSSSLSYSDIVLRSGAIRRGEGRVQLGATTRCELSPTVGWVGEEGGLSFFPKRWRPPFLTWNRSTERGTDHEQVVGPRGPCCGLWTHHQIHHASRIFTHRPVIPVQSLFQTPTRRRTSSVGRTRPGRTPVRRRSASSVCLHGAPVPPNEHNTTFIRVHSHTRTL